MDKASRYSSPHDKLAQSASMIAILPNDGIGARSSNRHRPLCTLSILIGSLSAFSVLLIAGITFAITYTSSLHSIDELGRGYAVSVVDAGRVQVEGLFAVPSNSFRTLSRLHQQEGIVEPKDDPTKWDVLKMASTAMLQARLGSPELTIAVLIYNDGSGVTIDDQHDVMMVQLSNARGLNATTKCCLENQQREFYVTNMTRPATQVFPYSQFTQDTQSAATESSEAFGRVLFHWNVARCDIVRGRCPTHFHTSFHRWRAEPVRLSRDGRVGDQSRDHRWLPRETETYSELPRLRVRLRPRHHRHHSPS
jgi:hypothetical protein